MKTFQVIACVFNISLAVLLAVSCGTTLAQKANLTNEAARDLRKTVGPPINAECLKCAEKCVADGVTKEKCEALTKCRVVRDAFYKAVEGVHLAIALYKVKKAAGEPEMTLDSILAAAQKALDEAVNVAIKSGYLKLPAPTGGGCFGSNC